MAVSQECGHAEEKPIISLTASRLLVSFSWLHAPTHPLKSSTVVATDQEAEGGVRLELTLGELCNLPDPSRAQPCCPPAGGHTNSNAAHHSYLSGI